MPERPLVLLDRLGCEAALPAIEPDRGEDLERRLRLGAERGRLRRLPLAPVHLAHQHLHLRERLLLGPPLPLAADLDEVLLRPDLEADAERATALVSLTRSRPVRGRGISSERSEGIRATRSGARKFAPSAAARPPEARRRRGRAGDVAAPRAADRPRRGRSAAGARPAGRRGGRRCGRPSRRSRRGGERPARRRQARRDPPAWSTSSDKPLGDRLDVFAVERHTPQAAEGRRLATIFSRQEPTKHTNVRTSKRERHLTRAQELPTRGARASPMRTSRPEPHSEPEDQHRESKSAATVAQRAVGSPWGRFGVRGRS